MPNRTMSDVLREAIRASGVPLLRLEKATGVHRASISRFLSGSRSLHLDVADKLAAYLKLELRPVTPRRPTK